MTEERRGGDLLCVLFSQKSHFNKQHKGTSDKTFKPSFQCHFQDQNNSIRKVNIFGQFNLEEQLGKRNAGVSNAREDRNSFVSLSSNTKTSAHSLLQKSERFRQITGKRSLYSIQLNFGIHCHRLQLWLSISITLKRGLCKFIETMAISGYWAGQLYIFSSIKGRNASLYELPGKKRWGWWFAFALMLYW